MPKYTFNCNNCGEFTITQSVTKALPIKCPTCEGEITRKYASVIQMWRCEGSFNARNHKE